MMLETLSQSREVVRKVALAALAEGLGKAPSEVPEAWAEAVADGRGTLPLAAEGAGGGEPPVELVLFDTDEIAGYVFESSRPPVIEGASTLLRELNRELAERYRKWTIFSGGGEGLLLVPRGLGRSVAREIEEAYAAKTLSTLGVTTGWRGVRPQELVASGEEPEPRGGVWEVSGTKAVLARLRDAVRQRKDARFAPGEVEGSRSRCVSCRDRAGELDIRPRRPEERGRLCRPCDHRWGFGKARISGLSFEEMVDDFEAQLGTTAARTRYLGFLYVDGNAMGALFGRVGSLARLRFLSGAVRGVFERVRERARARVADLLGRSPDAALPMIGLLGGGDEVIWILPGTLAVDLATRVAGWVTEESRKQPDLAELLAEAGLPGLTVGMGLVLSGETYPVRYQYELAKALQKSAKSLFYERPPAEAGSAIDFELLTDSSALSEDLESARESIYASRERGFYRTCRPFDLAAWERLVERTRAGTRYGIARSQLYQLQAGAEDGEAVFLNFLRYQIGRRASGEPYRRWLDAEGVDPTDPEAIAAMFVEDRAAGGGGLDGRGTWIPDAIQLAPFLQLVRTLEEKRHAAA